jgi:hypothetical protein
VRGTQGKTEERKEEVEEEAKRKRKRETSNRLTSSVSPIAHGCGECEAAFFTYAHAKHSLK